MEEDLKQHIRHYIFKECGVKITVVEQGKFTFDDKIEQMDYTLRHGKEGLEELCREVKVAELLYEMGALSMNIRDR